MCNEIVFRRIGHNELDAIQVCLAYVDAQNDDAEKDRTGAGLASTRSVPSATRAGRTAYQSTTQGDDASPLGDLVGGATGAGYRIGGERAP